METSCLMIEKAPIVSQVGRIAKCAPLWAAHPVSNMCQCREAASSKGRPRHPSRRADCGLSLHLRGPWANPEEAAVHMVVEIKNAAFDLMAAESP